MKSSEITVLILYKINNYQNSFVFIWIKIVIRLNLDNVDIGFYSQKKQKQKI